MQPGAETSDNSLEILVGLFHIQLGPPHTEIHTDSEVYRLSLEDRTWSVRSHMLLKRQIHQTAILNSIHCK